MIRALFLLAITVLLIASARSFLPQETSLVGSGAALAFGFVLLAALQTGTIVAGLKLPRLTGYLLCGFLAGPSVLNFVTERMLLDMKLVNNVAISLIALSAGAELNFKKLRPRLRAILSVSGFAILAALVVCTAGIFALTAILPFAKGMSVVDRLAVSLAMAVVLSALSPTVTLAIINETGADGPISEVVLGVVVVADLALVFSFAGVNAGVYYPGLVWDYHAYQVHPHVARDNTPNAARLAGACLSLPVHQHLTDSQIDRVITTTLEVVGN